MKNKKLEKTENEKNRQYEEYDILKQQNLKYHQNMHFNSFIVKIVEETTHEDYI